MHSPPTRTERKRRLGLLFVFQLDKLTEYLDHPVKRHIPVSLLPSVMRQQLMIGRKYIFSTSENMMNLCGFGLVSNGKRGTKNKEHVSKAPLFRRPLRVTLSPSLSS